MRPDMYGETEVMRRRSGELREQGVDLRALADRLVAQTESAGWTGRAAAALAGRHDTAADSLDAHVAEVDGLKDSIADIERKADSLVAEARTRIARTDAATHDVRIAPAP